MCDTTTSNYIWCPDLNQRVIKKTIVTKEYNEQGKLIKETTEEIIEEPNCSYPQVTWTTPQVTWTTTGANSPHL